MKYKTKKTIALIVLLVFAAVVVAVCGLDILKGLDEEQEKNLAASKKGLVADVTLPPSPTPTLSPTPTPVLVPEVKEHSENATEISISWTGREEQRFLLCYKEEESDVWHEKTAEGMSATATGLNKNTSYEFKIKEIEADGIYDYLGDIKFTTAKSGYGDPFKDIRTLFVYAAEKKSVAMSSTAGCLNAEVWPEYECFLYTDSALTAGPVYIKGGTAFTVTDGGEGYAFLRDNGRWSVHVTAGEINGWMDADLLLIDLCDIFTPEDVQFGIQTDRINAKASVLTAGGAANKVDRNSPEDSRYSIINGKSDVFAENGYNVIKGVTDIVLPNYGSMERMPVLWDLALELITCQKNALKKGAVLLVYDGYRPATASKTVYNTLVNSGIMIHAEGTTNLAQGYAVSYYSPASYAALNSVHNKGQAVDVSLMGFSGEDTLGTELKMQTKIHTLDFRSNIIYNNDSSKLLYDVMTKDTRLECLADKAEWWHFQMAEDAAYYPLLNNYIFADFVL